MNGTDVPFKKECIRVLVGILFPGQMENESNGESTLTDSSIFSFSFSRKTNSFPDAESMITCRHLDLKNASCRPVDGCYKWSVLTSSASTYVRPVTVG